MNAPLFSIVIPTYNRSDLVQGAVRSVLAQTFEDFEVLVSDNCSTDDTEQVVRRFEDPRVRYVRTPQHTAIADSWEFARTRARGSLVMMLSDDDALVRDALGRFADEHRRQGADFLFCNLAEYRDRTFVGPQQNTVTCRPYSGRVRRVSVDEFVRPLLAFRSAFDMHPSAFMFAARLADHVVARCGRFFQTNGVEYFAWPLAAVFSKAIVYLDAPLVILGRTAKSWGSTVVLSNPGKQQIDKMIADADQNRGWVPLTNFTLINLMAEGMYLGKQLFADELAPFPLDEQHYLRRTLVELRSRQAMGVDVERELRELFDYAGRYPSLKSELLSATAGVGQKSAIRTFARLLQLHRLRRRWHAEQQARKVRQGRANEGFTVSGADFGFTDAVGCAEFVWHVSTPAKAAPLGPTRDELSKTSLVGTTSA
jgi:glycosyltransferase involved in cell wall biosynthesis